jgi:NADH-quinone oxidoreductase subunit E
MNEMDILVVDEIVESFAQDKGTAIMILQQVQAKFGYVGSDMIERISEKTGIPSSDLFGITTFYAQFRLEPVGDNFIQVCHGTACHLAGAEQISEAVQNSAGLTSEGTSADGKFTLEHVACLGCCSHGPIMTLNGETHAKMNPEKVKKLMKQAGEKCKCGHHQQPADDVREECEVSE